MNAFTLTDITLELATRDDSSLINVFHGILEVKLNDQIIGRVNLLSRKSIPGIWHADNSLGLPPNSSGFMLSILMQSGENDHQLLGFAELNGPELYNSLGRQHEIPLTGFENCPTLILRAKIEAKENNQEVISGTDQRDIQLNEREIVRKLFSDGVASYHDFESYGNLQSLEQAISKFEAIIDMTPEMHPRLPTILCNLGAFLLSRFEELGEVIDMNDAIQRLETAVGLIPDGHPDKPSYLTNLGNALDSRFERFGDVDDINGAIVRKQTVVNLTPDGHPDKPSYLGNLGNSLWIRFRRLGNKDDINDAVTHHQAAINLTPDGHPDQPSNLSNLGNSLQTRFEWLGNLSDIDGSIAQQQAAVNLTPDGHPSKPSRLSNLGTCLQTRFERLGNVADINSAITHQQKAVNLTPERHPDMPLHLTSLGNSLQARFQRLGHVFDIDKAITHQQVAVKLTPDDHPNKSGRLNNLGTSLQTRFERFRRLEDLDNAIVEEQAAVLLTPDGHPNKPMYLTNLGNSLQTRFEILENVDDIDGSISQHQAAVELIPDGHPSKPGYLGNLGEGLRVRFLHLNDLRDAKLAIFYLSASAQSSVGSPTIRFKTAQRWISIASIIEHESLLIAYDCAINLMPLVAWLGLPISDRHEHLVQIGGIARDAAATAILMKKHDKALEWLEQGRSIVWNQVLQLRTPVDELRRVDSDLADRLVQISRLLDPGFERKEGLDFIEEEAQRYRALTSEWELIIEQVRSLPTFEDFLKPPRFSRLKNAARNGPVIVLNITEERCDALALVAGVEVTHIPLPNITSKKVNELRDELKDILYSNGLRLRGDRAAQKWTDESDSKNGWDILAELWNGVAKPVLDSLELSPQSNMLPHIWWCPTGPLAFLPIHAAGIYSSDSKNSQIIDYAISSYTPTLSALLEPSNRATDSPFKLLSVIQPSAPGVSSIPHTKQELECIQRHLRKREHVTLTGHEGTKQRVMKEMSDSNWVHLACHGTQRQDKPTKSGLILEDGHLTLEEIIKLDLPSAEFAYLSACQTTTGEESLSDEAVHIAGGMLLAGYRGVVATMWSIQDDLAPEVADEFYRYMMAEDGRPDNRKAAEALHFAVQKLRKKNDIPLTSWIPFVHLGV